MVRMVRMSGPSRRSTRRRHGISHLYATTDDNPKCRARHVSYNVDVESHDRKQEHATKIFVALYQDVPLSVLDIKEPTTSGHPAVNTKMVNEKKHMALA